MNEIIKLSAQIWLDGADDADAPELAPLIEAWANSTDDLTLCEFAEHVLCAS